MLSTLSGSQKAAMLFMTFGEEIASEVFKYMTEGEMKRIGSAMSGLPQSDPEALEAVLEELLALMRTEPKNHGENAKVSLPRVLAIEPHEWANPKILANLLHNEHPQSIAPVLVHLEPRRFAETLLFLPEDKHCELILRVSTLENGLHAVVEMLNVLSKENEERILNGLAEVDADLVEKICKMRFTFADLATLNANELGRLLRHVTIEQLEQALRLASMGVKEAILRSLSDADASYLQEELLKLKPIQISLVEQAQSDIMRVFYRREGQ